MRRIILWRSFATAPSTFSICITASLHRAERRRGILCHLSAELRGSNTGRARFAGADPDGAICHSPHCRRFRRAVGPTGDGLAGTLLSALQYPLLAEVDGAGFALAALITVAAVGDTV